MADDIRSDTARLGRSARRSARGVVAIQSILSAPPQGLTDSADLAEEIPWVLQSQVFRPGGNEYVALRSSGRLGLISDPVLLSAITRHYGELEYIAEMYRHDVEQSHRVAELFYPHVEFPRNEFTRSEDPVFPSPSVKPSIAAALVDPVVTNELTYLAFLKELTAGAAERGRNQAASLLELIEQELNRRWVRLSGATVVHGAQWMPGRKRWSRQSGAVTPRHRRAFVSLSRGTLSDNTSMNRNRQGSGIAIGIAIGAALGAAIGKVGAGVAIGVALGLAFGFHNDRGR